MYGTDYPFRGCLENVAGLQSCGFGTRDLRAIERDNALRVMPQLEPAQLPTLLMGPDEV